MKRSRKSIKAGIKTYFICLSVTLIAIVFIYNMGVVYVNSSQVQFGTDMSILEAQKKDPHTYVIELAGKRYVIDTTFAGEVIEESEKYYTLLPASVRWLGFMLGKTGSYPA